MRPPKISLLRCAVVVGAIVLVAAAVVGVGRDNDKFADKNINRQAVLTAGVKEICALNGCTILGKLETWRDLDRINPSIEFDPRSNSIDLQYDCADRLCDVILIKDSEGNWTPIRPEKPSN